MTLIIAMVTKMATKNKLKIGNLLFLNKFETFDREIFIEHKQIAMKKVNKQCLLDTPRTVRVSEKTWQVKV